MTWKEKKVIDETIVRWKRKKLYLLKTGMIPNVDGAWDCPLCIAYENDGFGDLTCERCPIYKVADNPQVDACVWGFEYSPLKEFGDADREDDPLTALVCCDQIIEALEWIREQ